MAVVPHCLKIGMKTNCYHLPKPLTIMMNECFPRFHHALWSHCLRPSRPLSFLAPLHVAVWSQVLPEQTSSVLSDIIRVHFYFLLSSCCVRYVITAIRCGGGEGLLDVLIDLASRNQSPPPQSQNVLQQFVGVCVCERDWETKQKHSSMFSVTLAHYLTYGQGGGSYGGVHTQIIKLW